MSEPFIAEIIMFGGNFAPRGWAFCNGQILPISQNQSLFSLLGTTFGGDGRTSFALPDMRGRVSIHPGSGPGLSTYRVGQKGGTETNTPTIATLAPHNHQVQATNQLGNKGGPGTDFLARLGTTTDGPKMYHDGPPNKIMDPAMITDTGGGQPVNNIQPYLAVNYIIALVGLFPSRN